MVMLLGAGIPTPGVAFARQERKLTGPVDRIVIC